jgi:hypothetical protein
LAVGLDGAVVVAATSSGDLSGVDAEEEGAGSEEEGDCGGELHFEVGRVFGFVEV